MGHYLSEMGGESYFTLKDRLLKTEFARNRRIDKIMNILKETSPEIFQKKTLFLGTESVHPLLEVYIRVVVQMNLEYYEEKYKDKL